jgi:methyltransferase (TIGR00027 family)
VRPDRPSLTATLVAGVRALYAAFPSGLRVAPDPDAEALVPAVLRLPARAVAAAPWAAPAFHHALGPLTVGLSWHVALRTLAIDDALRDALRAGARQIVLLGAGLDNRAGRLPEARAARVFEVDHPDMQRYKRERLEGAGGAGERIFVPVNFEVDQLGDALERAGHDAGQPTFWIWEGVTAYLTRPAVESTLRAVAERSAPGSRLAITYILPPEQMGERITRFATRLARLVGESVHASYEQPEMAALLGDLGFTVRSDEADIELASRYWKDPPGAHPRSIHLFPQWERLAVAERVAA